MNYSYTALKPNGKEEQGIIEAEHDTLAMEKLKKQGVFPLSLKKVKSAQTAVSSSTIVPPSSYQEIEEIIREISNLSDEGAGACLEEMLSEGTEIALESLISSGHNSEIPEKYTKLENLIKKSDDKVVIEAVNNLKRGFNFYLYVALAADFGRWGKLLTDEFKRQLKLAENDVEAFDDEDFAGFFKACEKDCNFWKMVKNSLIEVAQIDNIKLQSFCMEYLCDFVPKENDPDFIRLLELFCDSDNWRIRIKAKRYLNNYLEIENINQGISFFDKLRAWFFGYYY